MKLSKKGSIKPNLSASSSALIFYKGKILMIKRDNKPTIPNPNKWAIPGGRVEMGENFNQALERELKEEINIIPQKYHFLGFLKTPVDNIKRAVYFAELSENEYKKVKLGNEGQEIGWFSPEEIEKIDALEAIKSFVSKYKDSIKKAIQKELPMEKLLEILKKDRVLE